VNVSTLFKAGEKYMIDNSPRILSALGVTGTLTTAYLTAKASFKVGDLLREAEKDRVQLYELPPPPMDKWDKTKLAWKYYIPAVASGAATVACIVAANSIGASRYAALAAAYKLSEKSSQEYKDKVLEKLGIKKEQEIRDETAQDAIKRHPMGSQVIVTGNGDVPCYDKYSARYFKCDMQTLKKAMNDINYRVIQDGSATLAEFYEMIDLPTTLPSEEVGWDHENQFKIHFSSLINEEDDPTIVIDYEVAPMRNQGYPGFH
jgi:hypothetical protein